MYVGEMLNKCMVYGGVCEYRFFFVCVVDVRMWVRFVTMKVTAVTVGTKRIKNTAKNTDQIFNRGVRAQVQHTITDRQKQFTKKECHFSQRRSGNIYRLLPFFRMNFFFHFYLKTRFG